MISLLLLAFSTIILIQSRSHEMTRTLSNQFLHSPTTPRTKHEESREQLEAERESCLTGFQQQDKPFQRHQSISSSCKQYCAQTNDCQEGNEQPACVDPSWPFSTIRYVQKFERTCYIRFTEVLRYEQAEKMCETYGLRLATIDNLRLLDRLKESNMFNATCRGLCPKAKGYYIGLKRWRDNTNSSLSKWIWSTNETWTENSTDCDLHTHTAYENATLLCYIGNDGQKKITVWNQGEPNNHWSANYPSGEECVEIIAHTETSALDQVGQLNDIPCIKPTLGVICQVEDTKPINSSRLDRFAEIHRLDNTETIEDLFSGFGGPIAANFEAMAAMTAKLEKLLVLPSFTTNQATSVLNVVDQLVNITGLIEVESDVIKSVTNKLLHFLDRFPVKIQTSNTQNNISFQYENMNMSIVDINLNEEQNEWLMIQSDHSQEEMEDNRTTSIEVNTRVLQTYLRNSSDQRIIQISFANFNLFPQVNITHVGNPTSYQIGNLTRLQTDDDLLRYQIRVSESLQSTNVSCVYWSFDQNNGSWVSDDGCHFHGYVDNYAQCYCKHLTHFALMMLTESEQSSQTLTPLAKFILTFVTYTGICLSIVGLLMTLITYILFRRSQRNYLHESLIMLCVSILLVNCFYIPFSLTQSRRTQINHQLFCTILGFCIHYFLLTSFMWMLIMAMVQYMHFVRIFNTHVSYFFIKTCAIGWLVPIVFPLFVIFFGVNRGYMGENRCWINSSLLLYLTFLLPMSSIIICNLVLFGFILKSIFHHNAKLVTYQKNRPKLQIGAAACCFVSIGCSWLFGLIVLVDPSFVHQLIFCICNSFQGFFIFVFHVYLSKPKRELWQIFLIERGFRTRPLLSSGHTDLVALSSSSGHINGLTRPVMFLFRQTSSSSSDQQVKGNLEPLQVNRLANIASRAQPSRRQSPQKNPIERNHPYA